MKQEPTKKIKYLISYFKLFFLKLNPIRIGKIKLETSTLAFIQTKKLKRPFQ